MTDQPYNRILKSTTIIGGSSVINVVFKIIQSKLAAIFLGPTGVGLMGALNSILGVANTISGMGLSTSGVREIAQAVNIGNKKEISNIVSSFKILAIGFGVIGSILLFILRKPISQFTFGNLENATTIGFISLALFFFILSSTQLTLLRAMSHIGDLARVNIFAVIISTIFALPIFYFLRLNGIGLFILINAMITFLFSWFYTRKLSIVATTKKAYEIIRKSKSMLTLGVGFMVASITTTATTYLVNTIIIQKIGLDASGLFQASSSLSNVYVGFILGAMGTDFFPHLSTIAEDNKKTTELINAQTKVGLILASPGILAVFALGPIIINILYSNQFINAFEILRWQALGTFLRVISWPLSYLILAKGKIKLMVFAEFSTNLLYIACVWFGISFWGIKGIGIAFLVLYIYHVLINSIIGKYLSDFNWSKSNLALAFNLLLIILVGFGISFFLQNLWAIVLGMTLTLITAFISLRNIAKLMGLEKMHELMHWIQRKIKQ